MLCLTLINLRYWRPEYTLNVSVNETCTRGNNILCLLSLNQFTNDQSKLFVTRARTSFPDLCHIRPGQVSTLTSQEKID